jgi:hypothetical protein
MWPLSVAGTYLGAQSATPDRLQEDANQCVTNGLDPPSRRISPDNRRKQTYLKVLVAHSERVPMAGNSSRGVAETFGFATIRQPLDLLGLTVAKLYCDTLGNGDRVAQWPLPAISPLPKPLPPGSVVPNSAQSSTPNNSESDTHA